MVDRSGPDANANVELLVNDGGSVTCNGEEHPLDADRLLKARQLERDLEPQARARDPSCRRARGTDLSYTVRMEGGTVAFSDRSAGVPNTFQRLAAFTKDVTERVCGLER